MRIYLAGMTQTGFVWRGNSRSHNVLLTENIRRTYQWDLESFHYIGDNAMAPDYFRHLDRTIFLDSGAFSMFTKKVHISLERYAEYIKANKDWIHIASNIDAIGKGLEQVSYDNQKKLEQLMGNKSWMVCPVHHARDHDRWLVRYLKEEYPYIFLGGMVKEPTKYLRGWLDHVWDKYLTRKDGTAKIKVHGFGLTTMELIERYPWYSVDSTSWVLLGRYGAIYMDLPGGRDVKMLISSESPGVYTFDRHFDNKDHLTKAYIESYIRSIPTGEPAESGYPAYYDPALLRTDYGWRDHWNIRFFERLGQRLTPENTAFRKRQLSVWGD
jgi:hypothetical protein